MKRLREIFQKYTPLVEPYSIDEAFLDITHTVHIFGGAERIARTLKDDIRRELNLTASVGIGPNKILAKIASRLEKPDGLVVIRKGDLGERIYPLPISRLIGEGPGVEDVLDRLGIRTIGALAHFPKDSLLRRMGKWGSTLQKLARGEDDGRVLTEVERPDEKSMGHEHTFAEDTNNRTQIESELWYLVEKTGKRLRGGFLQGRTVTLKIRYDDFSTYTHQRTLGFLTNDEGILFQTVQSLFYEIYSPGRMVRLVGVCLSHLIKSGPENLHHQLDLFTVDWDWKTSRLYRTVDHLRDRFGEGIIGRASSFAGRIHYSRFQTRVVPTGHH